MNKSIIVIGIGEMSGVFIRGLLRCGYTLIPALRETDLALLAEQHANPSLVLIAVGEADLAPVLENLPDAWKNKVALLQNELLPAQWQQHQLQDPTVISVWFEKKPGQDYKVLIPSPVYGPHAEIILQGLRKLDIPAWQVANSKELLFELVRKNIYILCTNICGLKVGGDVNTLWTEHRHLALDVIDDVLRIQNHMTGADNDRERLIEGMAEAINGDLTHQCMGRSAPARLKRAIEYAQAHRIEVPTLQAIYSETC